MAVDWCSIENSLNNEDSHTVSNALKELHMNGTNKPSASLIQSALNKLHHHDVAIRNSSVSILSQCLRSENLALNGSTRELCRAIATPNLLDIRSGRDNQDEYQLLHKTLCTMINELQRKHPEYLMPHFKPIGAYLVNCTGNDNNMVATAACEYWAQLQVPPLSGKFMDMWVSAIMSKLGKLIPSLLKNMIYHEEHLKHLEMNTQDNASRSTPVTMEEFTNLRNYSALGLENICRLFQAEAIIIVKPWITKWLESSNWKEQEAIVLAFGALTEAVGTPQEMRDIYPSTIAKLLEFYSHPKPLVRSITCFTMQHFINVNPRILSIKDPYTKMLKCTLYLLSDFNREVQEMAIQSLSAMLAYTSRDILPYSKKLIDELVKVDPILNGNARYTYYECISHLFGHLGTLLDESQVSRLVTPLMANWKTLGHVDSQKDEIIMLCQALCVTAMYSKVRFAPYNGEIFKKVIPYFEQVVKTTDLGGEIVTAQTAAYLDVVSNMFEGQGQSLAIYLGKHQLSKHLLQILQESGFQDPVQQSALALLGHMCKHTYSHIHPRLDDFLNIIQKFMEHQSPGVRNNVMWCLWHIAANCPEENEQLLRSTKKLLQVTVKQDTEENILINACLALLATAQRWPGNLAEDVLKDDVFMKICIVLQKPFPRDMEKIILFKYFCTVISENLNDISKHSWIHFCTTAAVLDCTDSELSHMIKSVLRELRVKLGNSGWSKVAHSLGSQLSYAIRKKYKLY